MVYIKTKSFTGLQEEIFRLLCIKAGERLSQGEIARLIGATPMGVSKALRGLKGFVNVEKSKAMNLNLISLLRDSRTLRLKHLDNLRQIYESGLIEYLEENNPGSTIILFGSYSRGEDRSDSDIDIAIVGSEDKRTSLKNYEKILQRHINLGFYDSFAGIDKELRENLCNGIVLSGGIEL
ncbi:MAG: nucleotidyltransferase family protein [Nanobdellota archaeon]